MKRLLLLGGGHAHVQVLADLATRGLPGWEVLLVTPYARQIYSGMLPGWIAGHYPIEACAISLDTLAARARVGFLQASGTGLDLAGRQLLCSDGQRLPYDLISIDTGPMPALDGLPGSAAHALPIRPIEAFVAAWPAWVERLRQSASSAAAPWRLLVLGAGAAGLEVAFAIQRRARVEGWRGLQIRLVDPAGQPLRDAPPRARRRATELLAERGIEWLGQHRATRVSPGQLHLAQGEPLAFDLALMVTGAAAPAWPGRSGLVHPRRCIVAQRVASRGVRRRRRGRAARAAAEVGRVCRARRPGAGAQPAGGLHRAAARPLAAAAQGALPDQHRRASCPGMLGPLGRRRRLGLALERPHRPSLHASLRHAGMIAPPPLPRPRPAVPIPPCPLCP